MPKVIEVKPLAGYRLDVTFDDGARGTVDLSDMVGKGVCADWVDTSVFEQVRIGDSGELIWGDCIDICPDSLYLLVTGSSPEDLFPALRRESSHA